MHETSMNGAVAGRKRAVRQREERPRWHTSGLRLFSVAFPTNRRFTSALGSRPAWACSERSAEENVMRILFSGLVAAGLLTSQWAAAQCVRPADHAALDVAGLKTQLMVTALTCGADDRYNAFVTKYRPDLVNEEKVAGGYFSRSYGRTGKSRQDDYMTQLANSKSQTGLQQGNRFCDH